MNYVFLTFCYEFNDDEKIQVKFRNEEILNCYIKYFQN